MSKMSKTTDNDWLADVLASWQRRKSGQRRLLDGWRPLPGTGGIAWVRRWHREEIVQPQKPAPAFGRALRRACAE